MNVLDLLPIYNQLIELEEAIDKQTSYKRSQSRVLGLHHGFLKVQTAFLRYPYGGSPSYVQCLQDIEVRLGQAESTINHWVDEIALELEEVAGG